MNCKHLGVVTTLTAALCLISVNVAAGGKPVRVGCAPLDPEAAEMVGRVCLALGDDSRSELVITKKEFWAVAAKHGFDRETTDKQDFGHHPSEAGRAVLRELDVEMMYLVGPAAASGERRVVALGAVGYPQHFKVKLSDGSFDEESGMQRDIAISLLLTWGLEDFRQRGGWPKESRESKSTPTKKLSRNEQAVARMRETGLCFRLQDTDWHFCHSADSRLNGFVFGRKGKDFRLVRTSRSYRKDAHIHRFQETGFKRNRKSPFASTFEPFSQSGAPALVVSHETPRAVLSCGEATAELKPLSPKKSKKFLQSMSIKSDPPRRSVDLRKTEAGELLWLETIKYVWDTDAWRIYFGKPPHLKLYNVLHYSSYLDGGSTNYDLDGGAKLFLATRSMARDRSEKSVAQLRPDGSEIPAGWVPAVEFRWSTFQRSAEAPAAKLYHPDDAEKAKLITTVTDPPPIADPVEVTVCAVVQPSAKVKSD